MSSPSPTTSTTTTMARHYAALCEISASSESVWTRCFWPGLSQPDCHYQTSASLLLLLLVLGVAVETNRGHRDADVVVASLVRSGRWRVACREADTAAAAAAALSRTL